MEVVLSLSEARNMIPGYCISIHNAQGQEYPYCLTVITKKGAKLLSRNLVNSAISRGQKAALVVAESGALEICASRTDSTRNTRLIYLEAEKKSLLNLKVSGNV
jgi:exodeoxyribonuclease V alpha subunit